MKSLDCKHVGSYTLEIKNNSTVSSWSVITFMYNCRLAIGEYQYT